MALFCKFSIPNIYKINTLDGTVLEYQLHKAHLGIGNILVGDRKKSKHHCYYLQYKWKEVYIYLFIYHHIPRERLHGFSPNLVRPKICNTRCHDLTHGGEITKKQAFLFSLKWGLVWASVIINQEKPIIVLKGVGERNKLQIISHERRCFQSQTVVFQSNYLSHGN